MQSYGISYKSVRKLLKGYRRELPKFSQAHFSKALQSAKGFAALRDFAVKEFTVKKESKSENGL